MSKKTPQKQRSPIPDKTRDYIWKKYDKKCAYCGTDIKYDEMQIDHVDSFLKAQREGREIDKSASNMMPSCRLCNFYKSTLNVEQFRDRLQTMIPRLRDETFTFKVAEHYDIIEVNERPIKFWFEEFEEDETELINLIKRGNNNETR